MLRFEHHSEPLAHPIVFLVRMLRNLSVSLGIMLGSLALGVLGYHGFGGLPWLDALLNASMILSGMGQVDPVRTPAGKIFASVYALYSGIVFIAAAAVLLAPAVHRLLHHVHLVSREDEG